jgi:hypothetical protein
VRWFLALSVLALACEPDAPPRLTNRGSGRGIQPHAELDGPAVQPPAPGVPSGRAPRSPRVSNDRSRPGQPGEAPAEEAEEQAPAQDEGERLSADLARAFGTPTSCISRETRQRVTGTLTIHVQVTASITGVVTRANVWGSQLSDEDRECMTEHAEGIRLRGPINGAPRSITAQVDYTVASTPDEEVDLTPRPAPIPGNVAADRALPAAGTEQDRPGGFVPPSQTLPAIAP